MKNDYNFIKSTKEGICFWCGGLTDWIEINFEGYLHLECDEAATEDYWNSLESWTEEDFDF